MFAAFDQSEFHWIRGGGSKNLFPKACLLPLIKVSFIGFSAEAAKPCFQGHVCCLWPKWVSLDPWRRQQKPASKDMFAAFDQSELHWIRGGGSKNLLPKACLLPLTKASFIGFEAEAAKTCFQRHVCCLWPKRVSLSSRQGQQKPAS